MHNQQSKKTILLTVAIVALGIFNGLQLYGIVTDSPTKHIASGKNNLDSTHSPIQINVLNGCGIAGVGMTMTTFCRQAGYDVVEMGNYKSFDVVESMVIDRSGKVDDARRLATLVGISQNNVIQQFSNDHLVSASIVIGKDYKNLIPWQK